MQYDYNYQTGTSKVTITAPSKEDADRIFKEIFPAVQPTYKAGSNKAVFENAILDTRPLEVDYEPKANCI